MMKSQAVYHTIDGERIVLPQTKFEAHELGWHQGVQYNIFDITDHFPYDEFREWCVETFERGTCVWFTGGAWFLHEKDALFCKLRWQ